MATLVVIVSVRYAGFGKKAKWAIQLIQSYQNQARREDHPVQIFEMNSIAVPSEHCSFFSAVMKLRKINLVAINKVSLKGHRETLRGNIKQACSR